MKVDATELVINGITYVPKGKEISTAKNTDGLKCVLVRTYSAGIHFGYLAKQSEDGKRITLFNAKRIWAWYGAATLSQIAVEGVKRPKECKIPTAVPEIELTEAVEIIPISKAALESLNSVPVWAA